MAKYSSDRHNNDSDPYPGKVDWDKVRNSDPDMPGTKNFDSQLEKLDKQQGSEKGGCS